MLRRPTLPHSHHARVMGKHKVAALSDQDTQDTHCPLLFLLTPADSFMKETKQSWERCHFHEQGSFSKHRRSAPKPKMKGAYVPYLISTAFAYDLHTFSRTLKHPQVTVTYNSKYNLNANGCYRDYLGNNLFKLRCILFP